jgi:MmyB-like transcription regulator ligand binding domain
VKLGWRSGRLTSRTGSRSTPPSSPTCARATGRFPNDARLTQLIDTLTTRNRRFANLWATAAVAAHREDHKTIKHPQVGPITVDCDVLADADSELKIVVMTATPGSEDETKLQLATLAGRPEAVPRRGSNLGE